MERLRAHMDGSRARGSQKVTAPRRPGAEVLAGSPPEHSTRLAGARTDEERAKLALGLQQAYGNAYVQRLLSQGTVQRKPEDDAKSVWDLVQDFYDAASAGKKIAGGGAERATGVLELGLKAIDKLPKPPHIEKILKYYETHFALLKDVLGMAAKSEQIRAKLDAIEQNLLHYMVSLKRLYLDAEKIPDLSSILTDELLGPMEYAEVMTIVKAYETRVNAHDQALAVAMDKLEGVLQTFNDIQAKWGQEYEEPASSATERIGKSLPYTSEIALRVLDLMETEVKAQGFLERAKTARGFLQSRLEGVADFVPGPQ